MIKKKFETSDGLEFDTEEDAIRHESKSELNDFFESNISGYRGDWEQDITEHVDELIELLIKLKLVKPV